MRKIRQHNDIDIVVKLKNDEGAVLDATLIKEYKVFLTQVGYRLRIEDYQILPDGRIGFRFHAANQRIGVYSILVTAVTTDDRVFTTDVCNAFALVRCSCDAEDGSSDAEIEALEVNATFGITAWGGGGDSGGEVQTSLQYYDDGSGKVVPVKHPDLSTQPSILSYKFAGNYVYEQMVWVDGSRFTGDVREIDLIRFKDYNLDGENNIILDRHFFIVGDSSNGNYTPKGTSWFYFEMLSDDKRIFLRRIGSTLPVCKGVWIRVVWTSESKSGGYYDYNAPESKYNLYINASQYCTFSIAAPDNTFNMVEGKVPDAIVERFITEDHVGLYVHPKYSSQGKKYTIRCSETSEGYSPTVTAALIFIYAHDTYSGIVSLEYWFPQAAERLKKGEKTTLNVDIQYV